MLVRFQLILGFVSRDGRIISLLSAKSTTQESRDLRGDGVIGEARERRIARAWGGTDVSNDHAYLHEP